MDMGYTKATKEEIEKHYGISGIPKLVYGVLHKEVGHGYILFEDEDGLLFEVAGDKWEPEETSVFMILNIFASDVIAQNFFFALPDFLTFIKEYQLSKKSVVEELVEVAKAFNEEEMQSWLTKCKDYELIELGSFAAAVLEPVQKELSKRQKDSE